MADFFFNRFLLHRWLGPFAFLVVMWGVFSAAFVLGDIPTRGLELLFAGLGNFAGAHLPEGWWLHLLRDGVLGGVGGVVSFLPSILILFFLIAFLEDSGYIARAARLMDRVMRAFGLEGRAFLPMMVGFGCTVPAYMAARSVASPRERLLLMHVSTFMSCGARLPVYVLFCGAFFSPHVAGNIMFLIYAVGVAAAMLSARILRRVRFPGPRERPEMEMKPLCWPSWRGVFQHTWMRAWIYVRKAGTVILFASVVMWVMLEFPHPRAYSRDYDLLAAAVQVSSLPEAEKQSDLTALSRERSREDLQASFAGRLGLFLEPVFRPLGFDWRWGTGILSGFAAKEVIVSTLGTLYSVEGADGLRQALRGDPAYSPLAAVSFMVFVLLCAPCVSALTVFLRESGSRRETLFQLGYTTGLAYVMALLVFQGGRLIGL